MAVRQIEPIDRAELRATIQKWIDAHTDVDDTDGVGLLEDVLWEINAQPTLTPPNEWVSVEDAAPDPGERVLATDGIFVGEAYRSSANSWFRHTGFPWRDGVTGRTVRFWMSLPAPPDKDNNVLAKTTNEPLTLEHLRASPHGKIKDSTLQSICNRANEIACRPPEGEEDNNG